MFVNRLKTLLEYYVSSRQVTTFDKLISLMIADHVKPTLPSDCLDHILTVENALDQGLVTHDKLAEVVDAYVANHTHHTSSTSSTAVVSNMFAKPAQQLIPCISYGTNSPVDKTTKQERRCFHCDSRMHLFKHCPHRPKGTVNRTVDRSVTKPESSDDHSKPQTVT